MSELTGQFWPGPPPMADKRDRILAAATAVFAERDFHQVLVSEVASRAGVGKGTVYLYFPTKDALHRVALEASLEGVAAEVERAAEADAPVDAVLYEIVLTILRFFWRRPHLLTLVQRYEQRHQRVARQRRQRLVQAVARVLARHGLRRTDHELAVAFLLGLARAAILSHEPGDRPESYAARVVQLYLHGVAAQEPATRRRRASA
jgi:AcrR family transcriptional regulator